LDEVNSSLCHGFIFDFCGVEIDKVTGAVRVDKYVTMHDCGRILHPGMVAGQVTGGFAHALGAALYEEFAYAEDGSFLAGTFADYLVPTAMEVPAPVILHFESPSPFTPLGAKGVGEGNCMSTPVCVANAVADALGLDDVNLPITPAKLVAHIHPAEGVPPARIASAAEPKDGRALYGSGEAEIAAAPERIWAMLLDPATLAAIIPGAHDVQKVSDTEFRSDVTLGIGPVKGRYRASIVLSDLDPPHAVTLSGQITGLLGNGGGKGHIKLRPAGENRTALTYDYEAEIGGKVASVGGRLLDGAARFVIRQFFEALSRQLSEEKHVSWFARIPGLFGRRK
jgi:2-furoyl-CoA dehydrogenase large subunit